MEHWKRICCLGAAIGLAPLAWANQPPEKGHEQPAKVASTSAVSDAILGRCIELDRPNSEMYLTLKRTMDVGAARKGDDYEKSYEATIASLARIPAATILSACRNSLALPLREKGGEPSGAKR